MTEQNTPHWSHLLARGLPWDEESTVSITIDPNHSRPSMVMLASRLEGLVAALSPRGSGDGDPLHAEGAEDIRDLLDQLHRVRMALQSQEERVLQLAAHHKGVSLRSLASVLDVASPETVRYRLQQIDPAAERGYTAAAEVEG